MSTTTCRVCGSPCRRLDLKGRIAVGAAVYLVVVGAIAALWAPDWRLAATGALLAILATVIPVVMSP